MPVDAALIPKLREATFSALEDDYLSEGAMSSCAGQLVGEANHQMIRDLVLETLVSLLDDPAAKVVDAPMAYTFSDPEELRHHFESGWPRGQEHPLPFALIFWVVRRNDDTIGNAAIAPSSGLEDA